MVVELFTIGILKSDFYAVLSIINIEIGDQTINNSDLHNSMNSF